VTSPASVFELAMLFELPLALLLVEAGDEDAAASAEDPDAETTTVFEASVDAPVGTVASEFVPEAGWLVTGLLGSLTVG
jgi:hypothetical protein